MRHATALAAALAAALTSPGALADTRVGYLTLEGAYPERPHIAPGLLASEQPVQLRDLVATLESVAARDDLAGLVIRLKSPALSSTQIEELAGAMQEIRDAGKPIHVFSENYAPPEILIAANADDVILQSGGAVSFPGIYLEEIYLADTLRLVGIEPDFVQVGDYKGASEPFARTAPSPEWSQNIDRVLDDIYENTLQTITQGRGLSKAQATQALAACFWADANVAIEHAMIDAAIDRRDLNTHLESFYRDDVTLDDDVLISTAGPTPDLASMGMFEAFGAIMRALSQNTRPEPTRDTIALLHIDGAIVDGESASGLVGGANVGALTIRKALAEIEDNPHIKGLIVRINSPGGSATASEAIWLGLRRVADADKPVWASVGSLAASGGYYCAVGADRIYLNDSSIIGSIGVVGGHFALAGLYEKLHLNVVPRARGPRADLMGSLDPWSPDDRALIRTRMTQTYDLFTSRVSNARPAIDLDKTAQGRLFVGQRAIDLDMADSIGGLQVAIDDMARHIGLQDDAYDVLDYPPPLTLEELIEQMLGGSPSARATAPLTAALRAALGERAWTQLQPAINAACVLRDNPVSLVMPQALVWR